MYLREFQTRMQLTSDIVTKMADWSVSHKSSATCRNVIMIRVFNVSIFSQLLEVPTPDAEDASHVRDDSQ